jgi:hypothetical protein
MTGNIEKHDFDRPEPTKKIMTHMDCGKNQVHQIPKKNQEDILKP